jgi:hypothetical protein
MKIMAIAPLAADLDPVESNIAVNMKHRDCPVADIMRRGRLPNLSTVCACIRFCHDSSTTKYVPREEGMTQT